MNVYVVDASVAAKLLMEEAGTDAANALFRRSDALFLAPSLLHIELASVILKRQQRRDLDARQASLLFSKLNTLPIRLIETSSGLDAAFSLALTNHTSVYDCLYLAAAIEHDATLVTADTRFVRSLAKSPLGKRVRSLGDMG